MKNYKLKITKTETVETYILGKSKKEVKELIIKSLTALIDENKDPIDFFIGEKDRFYSVQIKKEKNTNV